MAAANARTAGFDGIELHAANGYLFDQFLRDGSNTRDDRYGGAIEGRMTFLREVVDAIGARIGFDRIGVKLSPLYTSVGMDDRDPDDLVHHRRPHAGRSADRLSARCRERLAVVGSCQGDRIRAPCSPRCARRSTAPM